MTVRLGRNDPPCNKLSYAMIISHLSGVNQPSRLRADAEGSGSDTVRSIGLEPYANADPREHGPVSDRITTEVHREWPAGRSARKPRARHG